MLKEKFVYKIINSKTGLFSTGGITPDFTKIGKTWTNIGHIKNHLNQFKKIPYDWKVLEYVLVDPPPSRTYLAIDLKNYKSHAYYDLDSKYFS